MKPKVLFIDLHGVMVNSKLIIRKYRALTIKHLVKEFDLSEESASQRYDRAFSIWEQSAFTFLKDRTKPKTGKAFLEFLEEKDRLFAEELYAGLNTECVPEETLRHRPFEFRLACKIEALYPEVRETLQKLYDNGYILHVASSNFSGHIHGILRGNLIEHFFETSIGFDTVAGTKHTMRFYKEMLRRTQARPKDSVMLGNSLHEILKPRKLGMHTIHINRERHVPADVQRLATFTLSSLDGLLTKLEKLK